MARHKMDVVVAMMSWTACKPSASPRLEAAISDRTPLKPQWDKCARYLQRFQEGSSLIKLLLLAMSPNPNSD